MRAWLQQHLDAMASALRKWRAQGAAGILHVVALGVALSLPSGGYALLQTLIAASGREALEPQLSLFLDAGTDREAARAIGERLRADARIATVHFVPRDQALAGLVARAGLGEVAAALERNPLPDTYVVRARDRDTSTLAAVAQDLRRLPGIEQVQVDTLWAERLAVAARIAGLGLAILAALLALGIVATAFNTIRLQVLTQRDEIEVAKLIGATDAFIQRPFLYLGVFQGLAGAAFALLIVWGSLEALEGELLALARSYGTTLWIAFLRADEAIPIMLGAGLLGWVGAYMSVSKYLREIEPK